jgi:hypothetical protein
VLHLFILEHNAEFAFSRAAIIADGGNIFDALLRQRLNQIIWEAGAAESAEHDPRAIGNIRDRGVQGTHNFGLHSSLRNIRIGVSYRLFPTGDKSATPTR